MQAILRDGPHGNLQVVYFAKVYCTLTDIHLTVVHRTTESPYRMSALTGNLPRTLLVLAVIAISFGGTLGVKSGAIPSLEELKPAHAQPITAGSFAFEQPADWDVMPAEHLESGAASATEGKVVAGLCPPQAASSCAPSSGVVYVLMQEEGQFPSLVAMRESLDRSLPRKFRDFHRGEVAMEQTVDRSSYLSYKFSFTSGNQRMTETIAVFRGQTGGAVIVAQGPRERFAENEEALHGMLVSGHEIGAHK